jgi:subtilase family serine protease
MRAVVCVGVVNHALRLVGDMLLEPLENRALLSGLTTAQMWHAYGFDQIRYSFQGATYLGSGRGQTIAIVEAYGDPNIASDLRTFDAANAIPNTDIHQQFVLTTATPQGPVAENDTWAKETAFDVEWAHGMAPKAHILLVQAKSSSFTDLVNAVDFARKQQGVSIVSMSWTVPEFTSETGYDNIFTTPAGHRGVTFVAATGDTGGQTAYPAASPHVVAVGGTNLSVDSHGNYLSETGWSNGGGGTSSIEQKVEPDVAYNAAPIQGYEIYNSTGLTPGWTVDAGTSGGTPQWAALIAIVNQGRGYLGTGALNGITQTLPSLHALPQDFHDITTGNNGHPATTGFDEVTGMGTPIANLLIPDLVFNAITTNATPAAVSPVFATGPTIASQVKPADWVDGMNPVLKSDAETLLG